MWKDVQNFEGLYQISNFGEVKSLLRTLPHSHSGKKTYASCLVKVNKSKRDKYHRVHLYKEAKRTVYLVHRLVLLTFIGPCPVGEEALHLDGNPENNCLDNLIWGFHSLNEFDKYNHGTMHCKPIVCSNGQTYRSLSEAGRLTGINVPDICSAAKGRLKTAGGLRWTYANLH